jgi:hypothetical protein
MHNDYDLLLVSARRAGGTLAGKYCSPNVFPVGYDFHAGLALFNEHCHEIGVEPMDERYYDSDPGTESMEALTAFLQVAEQLVPYQGPMYDRPDLAKPLQVTREPTPAWEQAHPYWREDMYTRHYGRLIEVRRGDDGYHARVVCSELLWEHGPVASCDVALEAAKAKLEATLSEYAKQRWLELDARLRSGEWEIGEGERHL